MKRLNLLTALAVLVATACSADDAGTNADALANSPSIAERMGNDVPTFSMATAEERDRAPYSPTGWPLEIGDTISFIEKNELRDRFPGWMENRSVLWVNGTDPFGAYYTTVGNLDFIYEGHYPVTTTQRERDFTQYGRGFFTPSWLRDRGATDHLYNPYGRHGYSNGRHVMADSFPVWRERYHEEWNRRWRNKDGGP